MKLLNKSLYLTLLASIFLSEISFSAEKIQEVQKILEQKELKFKTTLAEMAKVAKHRFVLTGSFAVWLHAEKSENITKKTSDKLLESVEDFDLIITDPVNIGKITLRKSLKHSKVLAINEDPYGTITVNGIFIDLLKMPRLSKVKPDFYGFQKTCLEIELLGQSVRVESLKQLLKRYKNNREERLKEEKIKKDENKIRILQTMLLSSPPKKSTKRALSPSNHQNTKKHITRISSSK